MKKSLVAYDGSRLAHPALDPQDRNTHLPYLGDHFDALLGSEVLRYSLAHVGHVLRVIIVGRLQA
jgi:hypothetical protein